MNQKSTSRVEDLAKEVIEQANAKRFVLALSGFAGAGKSTISQKLADILKDALIIHVDDFIIADENGAKIGYPHDWESIERLVLRKLHTETSIVSRTFDWRSNKLIRESQKVRHYIIIDGPSELFQEAYRKYFDLLVWINLPQDVANGRGMKRDREEYKIDHDELWKTVWSPKELRDFALIRPDLKADVLITNQ